MSASSSPFRCMPPYYPAPGESETLVLGKKMYLVCGKLVSKPGIYTSWPTADAQYKGVSGASIKGYYDYKLLVAAWHARCDSGEHDHPVDPDGSHARALPPSLPSAPSAPAATTPRPRGRAREHPSPRLRVYRIHSCSPTRTPSPISSTPSPTRGSPVSSTRIGTHDAPPAYTAISQNQ
ncbi:hypothetical protein MSAN_01584600 [Mycena sanguinolenta]|uniref:Ribonuclease H1 N-terminal domain-containing protein n=1 Tax=Mycena sanguinolenta TaxID=230812 RepID=A0A8H7CX85_9AGAR|nr:hypothetical protein MSAN_01584600 [Mycena sanguinolenta]